MWISWASSVPNVKAFSNGQAQTVGECWDKKNHHKYTNNFYQWEDCNYDIVVFEVLLLLSMMFVNKFVTEQHDGYDIQNMNDNEKKERKIYAK